MSSTYLQWLREEIERLRMQLPNAPKGSREAALACFDLWSDDPEASEEARRLLVAVEADREQSLLPIEDKHP
ncbi:hypothetical protein HRbin15_00325 [bacterium HR15]|nr:hypothetical protein HRbin15_00325 [bacterium HR15]